MKHSPQPKGVQRATDSASIASKRFAGPYEIPQELKQALSWANTKTQLLANTTKSFQKQLTSTRMFSILFSKQVVATCA
jgi:hypothetical protein